jgi:hypothetical protein
MLEKECSGRRQVGRKATLTQQHAGRQLAAGGPESPL